MDQYKLGEGCSSSEGIAAHDFQTNQSSIVAEGSFVFPSQVATVLPWTNTSNSAIAASHLLHSSTITTATAANQNPIQDHTRLYPPLPPPLPPHYAAYGDLYARRATGGVHIGYDGSLLPSDPFGLASGVYMGGGGAMSSTSSPFSSLQSEFGKMTAQEIMDAKALAASKSHSEAERRRRERINAHLARLRSLLPSTTKTDKASLLAEVIQHVKELKRQTSHIIEENPVPTESDELTVDAANDEDGKFVVKASMCCDDRSDLLTELIKALKALRLRTLKAEITTLGGRVKNVLVITGEDNSDGVNQNQYSINSIQDALKAVMERTGSDDTSAAKRQRTTSLTGVMEERSL